MATNQFLTLKDITAAEGASPVVGMVDNIVNVAPELDRVLGRPIPGISEKSLILTALGSNAAFRKIGGGVALSAPSFDRKRFGCMPWDCQMEVPEDILIEMKDSQTPNMIFDRFSYAAMRQKALKIGKQFYLGSANDPNGPMGLIDFLALQRTQVDTRTGLKIDQVIDCGGTNAGTCETIWFIKMGPADVCWLFGNGRGIVMNPWIRQRTAGVDSTVNNPTYRTAWLANTFGYIGTSFANYHAIGALINVDTTNGTVAPVNGAGGNGLWNDNVVADLYAKWPITESADLVFCTKRAATMLQKTRSVTNFVTGGDGRGFTTASAPIADFPTRLPTFNNIPIVVTDSITPANQIVLN
jgi:hypothetical protein